MRMEQKWAEYEAKNPAWRGATQWAKLNQALKLVRKTASLDRGSLVDGGQHAAPSKNRGPSKDKIKMIARLQGVSEDEAKSIMAKYGRGAR
jgi:hypothetical protein